MSKLRIRMSPLVSTSPSLMRPPPPPSHEGSSALICWWSTLKQTPLQPLRQKSTPLLLRILWTQHPAEQCQQSYEDTLMVVTLSERRLVWVWRVRAARVRGQAAAAAWYTWYIRTCTRPPLLAATDSSIVPIVSRRKKLV